MLKPAGLPNAVWERDWKNLDTHTHHHYLRSLQTPILTPYPNSPPDACSPAAPCHPLQAENKPVNATNAATAAQAQEALAAMLLLEGTAIQGCMHHASLMGVC